MNTPLVKERPILFSGAMVRAILEGRKTQTRRVCKQADMHAGLDTSAVWADAVYPAQDRGWIAWSGALRPGPELEAETKRLYREGFLCPYGAPGDLLWVRETLREGDDGVWIYAADGEPVGCDRADETAMIIWAHHKEGSVCTSIHMPRWASRLTLRVTDVRVEPVQDISEVDARAEGAPMGYYERDTPDGLEAVPTSYRGGFWWLWDEINAGRGYSWASNPWVWVVSFERV